MTINLSTQFTREDLDTLESLIEEHGDTVRNEWAYVTFGDVVDRLEAARNQRAEEAERARQDEEEPAYSQEEDAHSEDEATSALAGFLRKLADKLTS